MADRAPAVNAPSQHTVLGVPVHRVSMASALTYAGDLLQYPGAKLVLAANPEKVIAARNDPDLLEALRTASLVVPDGIGVVMAARLMGGNSIQRVPGSELMPALCTLAAREGHPVFLYGAKAHVVTRAAALLQEQNPGLEIAGAQDGYLAEDDMPRLIDTINASGARMLFVGLGSPRQELWMLRHYRALTGVRLIQGVGGTFDAICGHPPRAPALVRRMNLEWLYRLLSQPSRIRRQRALPVFFARVLQELVVRQEPKT